MQDRRSENAPSAYPTEQGARSVEEDNKRKQNSLNEIDVRPQIETKKQKKSTKQNDTAITHTYNR